MRIYTCTQIYVTLFILETVEPVEKRSRVTGKLKILIQLILKHPRLGLEWELTQQNVSSNDCQYSWPISYTDNLISTMCRTTKTHSSIARTHLAIIDSNIHNYPSETLFKQTHFVQFPISYAVTFGGSVRMRHKVFTNELYNPNSEQFKSMEKYVCDAVSTVKIESCAFSFS